MNLPNGEVVLSEPGILTHTLSSNGSPALRGDQGYGLSRSWRWLPEHSAAPSGSEPLYKDVCNYWHQIRVDRGESSEPPVNSPSGQLEAGRGTSPGPETQRENRRSFRGESGGVCEKILFIIYGF